LDSLHWHNLDLELFVLKYNLNLIRIQSNISIVGIGVGLYQSYGSAQRLYAKRGYIPDGRGVMYKQQPVTPGFDTCVDDDLNLH
jgi:hypothetical protein